MSNELKNAKNALKGAENALKAANEKLNAKQTVQVKMGKKTLVRPNSALIDSKKQYSAVLKAVNTNYEDICTLLYSGEELVNNEEKEEVIKFLFEVEEVTFNLNKVFFYFMNLAKVAKLEAKVEKLTKRVKKLEANSGEEKKATIKAKAERD